KWDRCFSSPEAWPAGDPDLPSWCMGSSHGGPDGKPSEHPTHHQIFDRVLLLFRATETGGFYCQDAQQQVNGSALGDRFLWRDICGPDFAVPRTALSCLANAPMG